MATYIRRRRHQIEGRTLLEECRGAERRIGSLSRQYWWKQEMDLEEDDEGAGGRGVLPRRFYNEAGNETDTTQGHGLITRDPHEHFMDRPEAAPDTDFVRGVDLDG